MSLIFFFHKEHPIQHRSKSSSRLSARVIASFIAQAYRVVLQERAALVSVNSALHFRDYIKSLQKFVFTPRKRSSIIKSAFTWIICSKMWWKLHNRILIWSPPSNQQDSPWVLLNMNGCRFDLWAIRWPPLRIIRPSMVRRGGGVGNPCEWASGVRYQSCYAEVRRAQQWKLHDVRGTLGIHSHPGSVWTH